MGSPDSWTFTRAEGQIYKRLTTPHKIQRFLNEEIAYNLEPSGETCYSPRTVLEKRSAHCMEGALLAAAALRLIGYPPLLVDLEAVRDSDHILAVYRESGRWGALAKSDYSGLGSREAVYKTIRELVMSYFEHYFNPAGEKTLRTFSKPVNLGRFDRIRWMTREEDVWEIPYYLCEIPHTKILAPGMDKKLSKMDRRLFAAGRLGAAH